MLPSGTPYLDFSCAAEVTSLLGGCLSYWRRVRHGFGVSSRSINLIQSISQWESMGQIVEDRRRGPRRRNGTFIPQYLRRIGESHQQDPHDVTPTWALFPRIKPREPIDWNAKNHTPTHMPSSRRHAFVDPPPRESGGHAFPGKFPRMA